MRPRVSVTTATICLLMAPAVARANDVAVTTTADAVTADGKCALREALISLNTGTRPGGTGAGECPQVAAGDVIVLAAATYVTTGGQSTSPYGDDGFGDLDVRKAVTLRGAGAGQTTLSAGGLSNVLETTGAGVVLDSLRISGGRAADGGEGTTDAVAGKPGGDGGGIRNTGTLRLRHVTVSGNAAGDGGAGAYVSGPQVDGGSGGSGGSGGGIFSSGSLTVELSTIRGNRSGNGGQGGTASASQYAGIGGGGGTGGAGGGVYATGTVQILRSTLEQNRTGTGGYGGTGYGGNGTSVTGTAPAGSGGLGRGGYGGDGGNGAAFAGTGDLADVIVRDNTAGQGGAGGYGHGGNGGYGDTNPGGAGGTGECGFGGSGGSGGAMSATRGSLTVSRSAISTNVTGVSGARGTADAGSGGVGSPTGPTGAVRCDPAETYSGHGGAIISLDAALSVINTTFNGNDVAKAGTPGYGGAIVAGSGSFDAWHVTFAGNGANTQSGAIAAGVAATIRASVFDHNGGTGCLGLNGATLVDEGGNVASASGACPGKKADPKLVALAPTGGLVPTMALASGSAARNAVAAGVCAAEDARKLPRGVGTACDAGAHEVRLPKATTTSITLSGTSAVVRGSVSSGGPAGTASVQYGPTTSYGKATTAQVVPVGLGTTDVAAKITGLTAGSTVHARVVMTTPEGTASGADVTLTVPAAPTQPTPTTTDPTTTDPTTTTTDPSTSPAATTPPPPPPTAPTTALEPVTPAATTSSDALRLSGLVILPPSANEPKARIRFTLSRRAPVTLRFERLRRGHRSGRRCSLNARRGPGCDVITPVGDVGFGLRGSGKVELRFDGRVDGHRLAAGRYRVTVTAGRGREAVTAFATLREPARRLRR